MKKIILAAIFIYVVVTLYSCSTSTHIEKTPNLNLAAYKSYIWVNIMSKEGDSSARATAFADLSVHNAVNEELQRWGWQEAHANPDVLISYDILVERNVETQKDPVYSQPYSRVYYNRFTKRYSGIYYPSQFLGYQQYQVPVKEATITLTMVDRKNDKTIWQGWTTETLGSSGIADLDVKKSIRNIFKAQSNGSVKIK